MIAKAGVSSSSENPPNWTSEKPHGSQRVPLRLRSGDLHALRARHRLAEAVADHELQQRDRHGDDERELRGLAEEVDVVAAQEVPAADAEHHDRPEDQAGEHRVHVRAEREPVRQERPDARQLRLPVHDLVADRVLHPRVRDEDEVAREPASDDGDPERRQVQARREPVPAEDPEAEEGRLEHERGEPLDRQRRPEDVADELRVDRPVHPELELLHEPGRDADREVDQEERPEEARQPQPGLVPGPVPERLHDRDEGPEPERQRHEQEVVERGRRELDAGEIDGRRRELAHANSKLESGSGAHIVRWG